MCRNRRLPPSPLLRLEVVRRRRASGKRATFPQVLCEEEEEEEEEEDLDHTYIVSPTGSASDSIPKRLLIKLMCKSARGWAPRVPN